MGRPNRHQAHQPPLLLTATAAAAGAAFRPAPEARSQVTKMTVGSCTPVPEEYLPVEAKGEGPGWVLRSEQTFSPAVRHACSTRPGALAHCCARARLVRSLACHYMLSLLPAGLVFDLDGELQPLSPAGYGAPWQGCALGMSLHLLAAFMAAQAGAFAVDRRWTFSTPVCSLQARCWTRCGTTGRPGSSWQRSTVSA